MPFSKLNWTDIGSELLLNGFVIIPRVFSNQLCSDFILMYEQDNFFRKHIKMERYNFGKGNYKYLSHPLPRIILNYRKQIYAGLLDYAREWNKRVKLDLDFPRTYKEFEINMKDRSQTKTTPLILKYLEDDYNCLHQDISGDIFFPYQCAVNLSEDYEGGEFLLVQQRPRMQSIPFVLKLNKGDCVFFSSLYHPVKGKRGYYRTQFRHGLSKITSGKRYALGIIIHDYKK